MRLKAQDILKTENHRFLSQISRDERVRTEPFQSLAWLQFGLRLCPFLSALASPSLRLKHVVLPDRASNLQKELES